MTFVTDPLVDTFTRSVTSGLGVSDSGHTWIPFGYRENLVPNPSFETNTTGWAVNSGHTLGRSTYDALSGTYSALVTANPGGAGGFIEISCPVTPGKRYSAHGKVRMTSSHPRSGLLRWSWHDSGGVMIGSAFNSATTSVTEDWTELSNTAVAPAGAAFARPRPYVANTTVRQNLVRNPSFTVDDTYWWFAANTTHSVVSTESTDVGGNSLEITLNVGAGNGVMCADTISGLTIGQTYSASMWIKIPVGNPNSYAVHITGVGGGNVISTTGSWQRSTVSFVATATEHVVYLNAITNPEGAVVYLDAVQFELSASATTYFDGDYFGATWTGTPSGSISTQADAYLVDEWMLSEGSQIGPYFDGTYADAEWSGVAHSSTSTSYAYPDLDLYSVDGSVGRWGIQARGSLSGAVVGDGLDRSNDTTIRFGVPVAPVGAHLDLFVLGRYELGDHASAIYRMYADGTADLSAYDSSVAPVFTAGPSWEGHATVNIRLSAVDETFKIKVWFDESAEPDNWTYRRDFESVNFNGFIGFGAQLGIANTNTLPFYITVDVPSGIGLPSTNRVTDNFNRNETDTLGTADSEDVWGYPNAPDEAEFDVYASGSMATVVYGGTAAAGAFASIGDNFDNVLVRAQFNCYGRTGDILDLPHADSTTGVIARWDESNDSFVAARLRWADTGNLYVVLYERVNGVQTDISEVIVGSYGILTYCNLQLEAIGSTIRAKAWIEGSTEPGGYQVASTTDLPIGGFPVGMSVTRGATGVAQDIYLSATYFTGIDINAVILATPNFLLETPGVDLEIKNGSYYTGVVVDRIHVHGLYQTEVVRNFDNAYLPSTVYAGVDYEMPLDEPVLYRLYALNGDGEVVSSSQSESVTVEVPYHRVIIRSVSDPSLSRRVQLTALPQLVSELRVLAENEVLGVREPVVVYDVMKGYSGSFSCINILDQEAIGLALRDLFNTGGVLRFQSVMRLSGVPDFYFVPKTVSGTMKETIHPDRVPRWLYEIQFTEVARPAADEADRGGTTFQTLIDVEHADWQSVLDVHATWLSVYSNTTLAPAV